MRRVGIAILLGALSGRLHADSVVPYLVAGSVPEGGVAVIREPRGAS
jgi:predicted Kef-type K+ transport protein